MQPLYLVHLAKWSTFGGREKVTYETAVVPPITPQYREQLSIKTDAPATPYTAVAAHPHASGTDAREIPPFRWIVQVINQVNCRDVGVYDCDIVMKKSVNYKIFSAVKNGCTEIIADDFTRVVPSCHHFVKVLKPLFHGKLLKLALDAPR